MTFLTELGIAETEIPRAEPQALTFFSRRLYASIFEVSDAAATTATLKAKVSIGTFVKRGTRYSAVITKEPHVGDVVIYCGVDHDWIRVGKLTRRVHGYMFISMPHEIDSVIPPPVDSVIAPDTGGHKPTFVTIRPVRPSRKRRAAVACEVSR